ncbi:hypothetical protein J3R83DRAFT_13496 [Lanmaoa asiatica]|nr:hypothetical protein J3R83DRAFT_13496 [Lanmaoa asiatica]
MDVPDISLVIQWRTSCNISALWQRFGRAARNRQLTGTALLFAEREHFDDERAAKAAKKALKAETHKRKASDADLPNSMRPAKRVAASNPVSRDDNADAVSLTAIVDELGNNSSLDHGINILINAKNRPGLGCRRIVFDVCFDNRMAGGRLEIS